jgi:hypothetical protein
MAAATTNGGMAVTNRDIQDRVLTLENTANTIREDVNDLRQTISAGFARLEQTGALSKDKENDNRKFIIQVALGLLATMFSSLFGIIIPALLVIASLVFFAIDSRTSSAIQPIREQSARNEENLKALTQAHLTEVGDLRDKVTKSSAADVDSRTDRANLNTIVREIQKELATMQADVATNHSERLAKEIEIETQFNADNQLRNIQFSDQQRINAMLFNALSAMGAKMPEYPRAPFFQPNISQQAKPGP